MRDPRVIVAMVLLLCAQVVAQPVKVLHLRVSGPIDCAKMAADFGAELERGKASGAGFVVVELDGAEARLDLVRDMGERLRSCGVASAALLSPGGKVGVGQAVLALHAGACYAGARTVIAARPPDPKADPMRLAPAGTDWEQVRREISGVLWSALKDRGGDPELGAVLVEPRASAWVLERDGVPVVVMQEPGDGEPATQIVWAGAAGFERLAFDAPTAAKLKVLSAMATGVGQVLADGGMVEASRDTRAIVSGLGAVRAQTEKSIRSAEVALERVRHELNVKSRLDRTVTVVDYRRAGEAALGMIAAVDETLAGVDRRVGEYPELLVVERPSARSTKAPADSIPGRMESVRKALEKHRVTAREYATRDR
jgi:hypothetical protein